MRPPAMWLYVTAASVCLTLTSCTHERIRSGDRTRHYILHMSESATRSHEPVPLILVFHGLGGSATGMRSQTDLDAEVDKLGWVVAYLEGSGLYAGWDGVGEADRRFVRDLIDALANEGQIDPNRVFAVGYSNGGRFAQRLACDERVALTAFVSVAAATDSATVIACASARPVPAMFMIGTEDPYVAWETSPVEASIESLTVDESLEHWARINSCSTTPTISYIRVEAGDHLIAQRWEYAHCETGNDVVLYRLPAHGHGWPPVIAVRSDADTLTAGRLIAEFFSPTPPSSP